MTDADSPKSIRSGGRKYAPPQALRLGDSSVGHGFDCESGSNAVSACSTTGSLAQACLTGLETGGQGACTTGSNASNCTTGNGAFGKAGCHPGSTPANT
jgi:hypothetical protein